MYTSINFKTKKALKEAIKAGERITIYQPGPYGGDEPTESDAASEGPIFYRATYLARSWLTEKQIPYKIK